MSGTDPAEDFFAAMRTMSDADLARYLSLGIEQLVMDDAENSPRSFHGRPDDVEPDDARSRRFDAGERVVRTGVDLRTARR